MSKQEDDLHKVGKNIDFLTKLGLLAFFIGGFVVLAFAAYVLIIFLAWLWMVVTV